MSTIHQMMMNEGPSGGHYQNIMSSAFNTLGIGLDYAGGVLWVTENFIQLYHREILSQTLEPSIPKHQFQR